MSGSDWLLVGGILVWAALVLWAIIDAARAEHRAAGRKAPPRSSQRRGRW